ncbi:MAG: hypothetical protein HQL57_08140 [Magnetococcales bacterium]|nr:hypothetical protein [Magnetococcales bacterium]MBF0157137.1 hypothetical protein [Magnetococcales bacterium]
MPRRFSNRELARFAPLFEGSVVNVSGWTDVDKEGGRYRDYFSAASDYRVTNFEPGQKGMQGMAGEIYLDLTRELPAELVGGFDVVFNHTTLEHIFECHQAFANLCRLSRDVVIVVVPYIQQVHGSGYSDYWRFTPHAMRKLYEANGLALRYCSANGADRASIYLFCLGYRQVSWDAKIPARFDLELDPDEPLYGHRYRNVIGGNVV